MKWKWLLIGLLAFSWSTYPAAAAGLPTRGVLLLANINGNAMLIETDPDSSSASANVGVNLGSIGQYYFLYTSAFSAQDTGFGGGTRRDLYFVPRQIRLQGGGPQPTETQVLVVDTGLGRIVKTLSLPRSLISMEYDSSTKSLLSVVADVGSNARLLRTNIDTGATSTVNANLGSVPLFYFAYYSAFSYGSDPALRRWYFVPRQVRQTSPGTAPRETQVLAVNVVTGQIVKTISLPPTALSMEFDWSRDALLAVDAPYPSNARLIRIALSNGATSVVNSDLGDIDAFYFASTSAFDFGGLQRRYFVARQPRSTRESPGPHPYEILSVDTQTGRILRTLRPGPTDVISMEKEDGFTGGFLLSLRLERTTVAEGGTIVGIVSRLAASDEPLEVELLSSNPRAASVPAHVTILARATLARFIVTGVDDTIVDGVQITRISARTRATPSVSSNDVTLTVTDNDTSAGRLALAV